MHRSTKPSLFDQTQTTTTHTRERTLSKLVPSHTQCNGVYPKHIITTTIFTKQKDVRDPRLTSVMSVQCPRSRPAALAKPRATMCDSNDTLKAARAETSPHDSLCSFGQATKNSREESLPKDNHGEGERFNLIEEGSLHSPRPRPRVGCPLEDDEGLPAIFILFQQTLFIAPLRCYFYYCCLLLLLWCLWG